MSGEKKIAEVIACIVRTEAVKNSTALNHKRISPKKLHRNMCIEELTGEHLARKM